MEKRPFLTTPVPEQVQQKWKQEKQVLLLVENPKVEAVMRQYPNLKHIYLKGRDEVNACFQHFDLLLIENERCLEGLPKYVKDAIRIKQIKSQGWCQNLQPDITIAFTGDDPYSPHAGPMVCKAVEYVRSIGYGVRIQSQDIKFIPAICDVIKNDPNCITVCFTYNKKGADLCYDISYEKEQESLNNLRWKLLDQCRKRESKTEYLNRMYPFLKESMGKYIQVLKKDEEEYFYKTVNRSLFKMNSEWQKAIQNLRQSKDSGVFSVKEDNRYLWESISQICYYEEAKEQEYKRQLDCFYINITNMPDMILSYLGSRKCNMDCKYCFSDHSKGNPSQLTDQDIIHTLDYCMKLHGAQFVHIDNFLGGEPCMEFQSIQRLFKITCEYQKSHNLNFSFGLLTNGTLMDKKHLDWLYGNIPYIGLSLDGDEKTNDRLRVYPNGKGTYRDAVRFIKQINEWSWPVPIGVSCVLTGKNLDMTAIFKHLFYDLGIHYITIKPVRAGSDSGYALTIDNLPLLEAAYEEFIGFLLNEAKKGKLEPLFAILHPIDYLGRFLGRVGLEDRVIVKRCGAGEHIFSVDNDNQIYACDSFNGVPEAYIGKWSSQKEKSGFYVPYVTQVTGLPCHSCWARYECGGVCSYVRYLNKGKLTDVIRFECEFSQFLIRESLLFWEHARNELSKPQFDAIKQRLNEVGFSNYQNNRDHFFYAPC